MPPGPPGTIDLVPTPAVIAHAAERAGFAGQDLLIAVQVALAEHGGTVHTTKISPTGDYGVWQINYAAHKDLFEQFKNWGLPEENAKMARAVWTERGWNAWTTYRSGAYQRYQKQAVDGIVEARLGTGGDPTIGDSTGNPFSPENQAADDQTKYQGGLDWVGQIAQAVVSIAQIAWRAMKWMIDPHNWVRAALVGTGGALVVGALVIVARPGVETVQKVVK
jgi:hypothetical protein